MRLRELGALVFRSCTFLLLFCSPSPSGGWSNIINSSWHQRTEQVAIIIRAAQNPPDTAANGSSVASSTTPSATTKTTTKANGAESLWERKRGVGCVNRG